MRPQPLLIYGKPGPRELCYALAKRKIPKGEEKANRNSPELEIAVNSSKQTSLQILIATLKAFSKTGELPALIKPEIQSFDRAGVASGFVHVEQARVHLHVAFGYRKFCGHGV